MAKPTIRSKTLWVNVVALVAIGIQAYNGYVISAGEEAAILSVVNIVLRLITNEGIEGLY